jgi:3-oxoacyl-[acyl-carrier-protein] synthase-3
VPKTGASGISEAIMASGNVSGVRIAGIASTVPEETRRPEDSAEFFGLEQARKISQSVGVETRHVASDRVCTSDLCFTAATRLLQELHWPPSEIAGLIFVTQTPDYLLPGTSHVLHHRLGLPSSCYAMDINLGCSGYVYGLWVAASLMQNVKGNVLLLVGDTSSRIASPQDQSVALLFGDAGTATALTPDASALPMFFELGADGAGFNELIVRAGGFRNPCNPDTAIRTLREGQNIRSDQDLFMNGPEVFTFTLQRVPPLIKALLHNAGRQIDEIDGFVFHQANRFMLEHLAKRMKLPAEKFVIALENFGNTSSASIPLAITTTNLRTRMQESGLRLLLAGFGVGFSWAAVLLNCGPAVCPELVEYGRAAQLETLA